MRIPDGDDVTDIAGRKTRAKLDFLRIMRIICVVPVMRDYVGFIFMPCFCYLIAFGFAVDR